MLAGVEMAGGLLPLAVTAGGLLPAGAVRDSLLAEVMVVEEGGELVPSLPMLVLPVLLLVLLLLVMALELAVAVVLGVEENLALTISKSSASWRESSLKEGLL